jgi:glycosyltransferase involved in cell wall biosynthesis
MFVFNSGNHDQRVHKQAQALGKRGFDVRVYCFLEPGLPFCEKRDGYLLLREDQRSHTCRFLDHQIFGRLRKKKCSPQTCCGTAAPELPKDREPQRPCTKPERTLREKAHEHQREHWRYIERINQVWAQRAEGWRPDLVQAHDLDALRAAVLLGEKLKVPVVYDTHELWSEQPFIDSQEAVAYWNELEAQLAPKADLVMTVNEPLARILEERYGLEGVLAIHNCQEKQTLPIRELNRKPIALYQGAYVPHRGIEQVIAAAAKLEHVQIALRGFGPCESQFKALDPRGDILWWDPVPGPEVVSAAAQADIGLIPFLPTCLNHYYSTPNKLFEYMSAGLAVAGSDIPEVRKFVTEYDLGALFDPYSPNDIAATLDGLVSSGALAAKKERARRTSEERWNWETEIERYVTSVRQLAGAG